MPLRSAFVLQIDKGGKGSSQNQQSEESSSILRAKIQHAGYRQKMNAGRIIHSRINCDQEKTQTYQTCDQDGLAQTDTADSTRKT
jgi:hypothetical protein